MKKGTLKTVAVVLAFLLLGTAVVACMTQGFSDWNPYGWFDTTEDCEHEYDEDGKCTKCGEEKQETACVMSITPHNVEGLSLLYAPLSVANSVETLSSAEETTTAQVVATLTSGKASKVAWSLAFKDASSAWASGKNVSDYVEYSVSADTFTVTLTCKAAFGETIILTCTASEANLTATCNIEYSQKLLKNPYVIVDGVGVKLLEGFSTDYVYQLATSSATRVTSYIDLSVYTTYAYTYEFTRISSCTFILPDDVQSFIDSVLPSKDEVNYTNSKQYLPVNKGNEGTNCFADFFVCFSDFLSVKEGASANTVAAVESVRSYIKETYGFSMGEVCNLVVSAIYSLNGETQTASLHGAAYLSPTLLNSSTSTLTLNSSEVVF